MRTTRGTGARLLLATALGAGVLSVLGDAQAIVGRPLTPVSYAGVARRTTRRTVATTAAVTTGAAVAVGTTAAVTAGALTALPGGCVRAPVAGTYYSCGGTYYRPTYEGPNVVYVVSPAP